MAKFVVILGFLLSFAAGLVIGSRSPGLFVERAPADETTGRPATTAPSPRKDKDHGGWLSAELGLTGGQRQQLDRIWSETARRGRDEQDDRRRQYRRDRDAAIADLVPPARLGEYDQIIDAYHDRVADLERESHEAYAAAVERTKQILTPEQRTRYEELLKRHKWGTPGAARDRHNGRRAETRATSQPDRADPVTSSHEPSKGADR